MKVVIDVDDEMINQAVLKELKERTQQVVRLQKRVAKLKLQICKQQIRLENTIQLMNTYKLSSIKHS